MGGEMARRGVQFLLGLALWMKLMQPAAAEHRRVNPALFDVIRPGDKRQQGVKILDAFAGTEVNAEAVAIGGRMIGVEQAGVFERLAGGGGGELAVDARMFPAARVGNKSAEVEVLHLCGEVRRKALGVKAINQPYAAVALKQAANIASTLHDPAVIAPMPVMTTRRLISFHW